MKTKLFVFLAVTLALGNSAFGQYAPDSPELVAVRRAAPPQSLFVETTNFVVNLPIPDNNLSGVASSVDVTSSFQRMGDLNVTLRISGSFNGDLYGYLAHDTGFAVLINRVGRTASNEFGYGDGGMDIRIDDDAALGDIHVYRVRLSGSANTALTGPLTGTWAPDGRAVDPTTVTDANVRTQLLNSFINVDPNGRWTLFLADLSPGGTSTLVSWGLEITNIPEPKPIALMIAGSFALLLLTQRLRKSGSV